MLWVWSVQFDSAQASLWECEWAGFMWVHLSKKGGKIQPRETQTRWVHITTWQLGRKRWDSSMVAMNMKVCLYLWQTLIYLERVRNCKMNTMFLQKHIDPCVNALWETHDIYSMACCLCPLKIHRLSKNSRKSYGSESNHISLVQSICSRSGIDLGWDQPLPDPTMLH